MGEHLTDALVTILGGIAAVAIVALIVSKKSQTPAVIQSFGSAYGNSLAVAVSPVTGAVPQPNLSYPGGASGFSPTFTGSFG